MSNESKQNQIGAVWIKQGHYGEYLSIAIEIDGVKHNFAAFRSKYKEEGDNKPNYYIPAPTPKIAETRRSDQSSADTGVSKYDAQLEEIMRKKREAIKAATMEQMNLQEPTITEEDVPF